MISAGEWIGHYQIESRLGKGGFGEVFSAHDRRDHRRVAVKLLRADLMADPQLRHRFLTEADALERLDHPHIVRLLEICEQADQLCIVMEYLEGDSLRRLISRGAVSSGDAFTWARQIAVALSYAHARGILHRDIKPENVIIHPERGAVLLDFGLARMSDEATATNPGQIMGSWRYMSPEQIRGELVDRRTDIFSLGVVFYEMLSGELPFAGNYDAAVVYSILNESARPLRLPAGDVPTRAADIINHALLKSREQRYQTLDQFLQDLDALASGSQLRYAQGRAHPVISEPWPTLILLPVANAAGSDFGFLAHGITSELTAQFERILHLHIVRGLPEAIGTDTLPAPTPSQGETFLLELKLEAHEDGPRLFSELREWRHQSVIWSDSSPVDSQPLDERVSAVVGAVTKALGIDDNAGVAATRIAVATQPAPEAYEFYLRGKFRFDHKQSGEDVKVAEGLFRQALQLSPRFIGARVGLAQVYIHSGEFDHALSGLSQTLAEPSPAMTREVEAEIELLMAQALFLKSDWSEAIRHAERARVLARAAGNLPIEARSLAVMIDVYEPQARYAEAAALYNRVVRINQQLRRKDKVAAALKSIAVIFQRRGQFNKALNYYDEALELCHAQELRNLEAKIMNNVGLILLQRGNFGAAAERFSLALRLHRDLGEYASFSVNLNNLGVVKFMLGEYDDALSAFKEAEQCAVEVHDRKNQALAIENQGKVCGLVGDYRVAARLNLEAKTLATELNFQLVIATATCNQADLALYQDDFAAAAAFYAEALNACAGADLQHERVRVLLGLCRLAERRHEFDECRQFADEALAICFRLRLRNQSLLASVFRHYARQRFAQSDDRYLRVAAFLKGINSTIERHQSITMTRLAAAALYFADKSHAHATDVRRRLSDVLARARKHRLVHEQRWIAEFVAQIDSNKPPPA